MITLHHKPSAISLRLLAEIAMIAGLILAIAIPRLLSLNSFVTTDERLWLERSGRFYYALAHHNFAETFQKSHPGVTVMWAGLVGYMRVFPQYRAGVEGQDRPVQVNSLKKQAFDLPLRILVAGRQAMVFMHLVALVFGFLFASRLFGKLPALIGFLLIAFDPFHIALSRVLHLDGLLADLMLLALLAFLTYLAAGDKFALLVSSLAAGLAWLTKSPGLFLAPLIFLFVLLDFVRSNSTWREAGWKKSALHYAGVLIIWGVIAGLILCFLWPAMWVNPVGSVSRVLGDAIGYAGAGHDSAVFFNGKIYPNGEIPDLDFYPISFLWRTTPITLLGLLAVVLMFIKRLRASHFGFKTSTSFSDNTITTDDQQWWAIMALLFLVVGFGLLMTFGLKKFDRYLMPSIVTLDLIAGVGLVWLGRWISHYVSGKWTVTVHVVLLFGLVAFQATLAWIAFPYFFNYYNPLLGGGPQAVKVMQIGWGEGLDQAAQYINSKPNPETIRVIAWYGSAPFSYFSKSLVSPLDVDHPWSAEDWKQFDKSDYAVVYIHEWQRNLPAEVLDRLKDVKPEYSVWIDGLEYVQVYKIQ